MNKAHYHTKHYKKQAQQKFPTRMLLRIEVFPPAGKTSGAEGKSKASQTLFVSPSTVENRFGKKSTAEDDKTDDDATVDGDEKLQSSNDSNPNAGSVVTIGRKGEMDILFGADRSISRQHALLRFVAPRFEAKPNSKRKTRGRRPKEDASSSAVNAGCFMEPRNEEEQLACDESPYGMCLVLENKGKSGSYIPSRDESVTGDGDDKKEDSNAHDSDATTDDEGVTASAGGQSSQRNYGTATSLTTQLGEVIVSLNKLSSSQKLPSLSGVVQHHFGNETPVQLTKLDADESLVLKFDGSFGNGKDETSVMVQFGCAQLPTIQITLIPMTVVFSSGVPTSIQDSLRLCGGLGQEGLPHSQGEDTNGTTHLVATERMAVAKQLIAWCYSIPIVSPDFLVAMRNHSSPKDPFPLAADFPSIATDTSAFWDWKPDPKLLARYTMISVDPSPEVEQAEGLALAAGATLERLYDPKKKPTKAKIQTFLKRVSELLQEASSPWKVVLLSSKTKSKWSNNNTMQFLKQLKEELLIPPVGSKILAKTITKQESFLVGLEPKATSIGSSGNGSTTTRSSGRNQEKPTDLSTIASERTSIADTGGKAPIEEEETPESPGWQLQKTNPKRDHESVCKEKAGEIHAIEEKTELEEIPSDSRSKKRRKVDHQEEEGEEDFVLPVDNDESMRVAANSSSDKEHSTNKQNSSSTKTVAFGKADSNGWFTAAPKDDRERSRLRQRASLAYQKETGVALEPSASTDVSIHVAAMTDSTNHHSTGRTYSASASVRQKKTNLPNFKRFRKNCVLATDEEEVIILVDATLSEASRAPEQLNAEEIEMMENQRLAEALFHGERVPGMVKKKRVRK